MRKTLSAAALILALPLAAHAAPTEWKGTADGISQITVRFDPASGKVSLLGSGPVCGGEVDGKGVRTANSLTLTASNNMGECKVQMTLDGAGNITASSENGPCMFFHGAQCDFDAISARRVH